MLQVQSHTFTGSPFSWQYLLYERILKESADACFTVRREVIHLDTAHMCREVWLRAVAD